MRAFRFWAAGGFVLLITAGLLATYLCSPVDPVNPDNMERIVPGMTLQEVAEILGRPDDDDTASLLFGVGVNSDAGLDSRIWLGKEYVLRVDVDSEGRVADRWWLPHDRPSLLQRVLSWLGH